MPSALSPRDYDLVQAVYVKLVHSDWFDRTDDNERACARLVLMQFGEGGLESTGLFERCEALARSRFGRTT